MNLLNLSSHTALSFGCFVLENRISDDYTSSLSHLVTISNKKTSHKGV